MKGLRVSVWKQSRVTKAGVGYNRRGKILKECDSLFRQTETLEIAFRMSVGVAVCRDKYESNRNRSG